jgi:hypothetical protein
VGKYVFTMLFLSYFLDRIMSAVAIRGDFRCFVFLWD